MELTNELKVSILQDGIVWESCAANLEYLNNIIPGLAGKTDIIVLPEMFSTGFSMRPHLFAEELNGIAQLKMQEWSTLTGAAVCGSIMVRDGDIFYNRFFWFEPKPNTQFYDKAHLFRMGEEQLHYNKGVKQLLILYKGWKIAPFVCYDLRFPVWLRRTHAFNYDLILLVANWPERRIGHWKALTLARAIENQAYVAAVNRIGIDGSGITHSGASCIVSPIGEVIFDAKDQAVCETIKISKLDLEKYRESFPVGLDADTFTLNNVCNDFVI
jgi:predicted amidohydrolase